ncbi:hypothetical protein [Sediminicoccus sp. BL-A-41-H5]|uniref:hypothetical protein n=1 Tax=Sediminicoccus sp. BL-A-41-H5 TaxID=3421106 RepID=UPI003D6740D9
MTENPLAAPEGLEVRIRDLSDPEGEDSVEVVRGFISLAHANEFAKRYVRDSVERCRVPRATAAEVTAAWFAFGEDAGVSGLGEDHQGEVWQSANDLPAFAAAPPRDREALNWRMLDPRRMEEDEDDGEGEEE